MPVLQLGDLDPDKKFSGAWACLWTDLETTGTEVEYDDIIEIGALVTDFELNQIGEPFSQLVEPNEYSLGRMMKNPVVRNMHTDNGLLDELLSSRNVVSHNEAEKKMLNWLQGIVNRSRTRGSVEKFRFMLAGSGVDHFDKKFIHEYMPSLDKLLVYSPLDIGHVRRFLRVSGIELAGTPSKDDKAHRALDDVYSHLEEARYYRETLRAKFVLS